MSSNPIGFNQVALLMKKFEKVDWDAARITQLGQANAKKFRAIEAILDGAALDAALQAAARAIGDTTHLRYLSSTILAPTQGNITLAQSADFYIGHLDSDFTNWGTDVAGVDTEETLADLYEMKKNGSYAQLFGSLVGAQGSYDEIAAACRPLCWQQGQIVEFSHTHSALLQQDGWATFFLFEVEIDGKPVLFVASVHVIGGELEALVDRFSRDGVWNAGNRRRVVVPQQTV